MKNLHSLIFLLFSSTLKLFGIFIDSVLLLITSFFDEITTIRYVSTKRIQRAIYLSTAGR
jgi:hypothetical protein